MEDTKYCNNCRNRVSVASWELHEVSCVRHRYYCEKCQQVVPKKDAVQHEEEFHALVECQCGEKMEAQHLTAHAQFECGYRLEPCMYCECPHHIYTLPEHEEECGARTDVCEQCGERMPLKNLSRHICAPPQPLPQEPAPTEDVVICPFCQMSQVDYMYLQEHIFSEHPELIT